MRDMWYYLRRAITPTWWERIVDWFDWVNWSDPEPWVATFCLLVAILYFVLFVYRVATLI